MFLLHLVNGVEGVGNSEAVGITQSSSAELSAVSNRVRALIIHGFSDLSVSKPLFSDKKASVLNGF